MGNITHSLETMLFEKKFIYCFLFCFSFGALCGTFVSWFQCRFNVVPFNVIDHAAISVALRDIRQLLFSNLLTCVLIAIISISQVRLVLYEILFFMKAFFISYLAYLFIYSYSVHGFVFSVSVFCLYFILLLPLQLITAMILSLRKLNSSAKSPYSILLLCNLSAALLSSSVERLFIQRFLPID